MAKQRANIRDVAKESGVSLTTVSLIINKNDQRISEPTRQRVLEVIEKLAYTPSRLARGLPNRRANTLAILVPQLQNAFADVYFGELISGIYEEAAARGFRILLEVARRDYIKRREYMQLLEDCSVDGIFFLGATEEHKFLKEFDGSDRPLMVVNNHFTQWNLHHVVCDYRGAGTKAADHLIELGHSRIAHISGPSDVVLTTRELTEAFVERLAEHGVHLSKSMIAGGEFQVETARIACDELLKRNRDLTAIFCANDKMAIGAYQSLRAHGRQPGKDISVVGCDDIPVSALSDPPLTTVRMNFFEVGAESCRQMISMIDAKTGDQPDRISERIPVELIRRASTVKLG